MEQFVEVPSANGVKPGLDPIHRTWISQAGYVFHLRPISWAAVERLTNDPRDKPKIPKVRVVYGGNQEGWESNPEDAAYKDELATWKAERQHRMLIYAIGNGIADPVPQEFQDEQKEWFPQATLAELRYFWVATLVSAEELTPLMSTIIGQNAPTEAGIEQAVATFRSAGERG